MAGAHEGGAKRGPIALSLAGVVFTVGWLAAQAPGAESLARGGGPPFAGKMPALWNYLAHRNLGVVDADPAGLILRSAEPSPEFLERLMRRYGLRTVVSLNGNLDKPARRRGETVNLRDFIAALGLRHESFRLKSRRVPPREELLRILGVLADDSAKPILLHCKGGADRTGLIAALYQIEFLGRSKREAKEEMRRHLWLGRRGTEALGAYVDGYRPGTLSADLEARGHGAHAPRR